MTPPEFFKVTREDFGRVGSLGACILALVRYMTALPSESDGRRLVDGQTWWRASAPDIAEALGGGTSPRTVSDKVKQLIFSGDLTAIPTQDFYGDRAKAYRTSDLPSAENDTGFDLPSADIADRSADIAEHVGRKRHTPSADIADLPSLEELEEEREKACAVEHESPGAESVPTQLNDRPPQTVNEYGDAPSTRPSPYCARHPQGTTAKCAACGTAREKRNAWDQEQAARIDAERATIRAAISACPDCDQNGFTEPDEGPTQRCTQHRQLADLPAIRKAS